MIVTARTTRGRESTAINAIKTETKNKDLGINAAFHPSDLRGYVFIEGSESDLQELRSAVRQINGYIDEEVEIDEIEKYLDDEEEDIRLEEGDKVDVIGGPFKGEEAKITRVDDTNREVTIELLDAAVPIPTTVDVDTVRKKA